MWHMREISFSSHSLFEINIKLSVEQKWTLHIGFMGNEAVAKANDDVEGCSTGGVGAYFLFLVIYLYICILCMYIILHDFRV